jgi:hypothetical protein
METMTQKPRPSPSEKVTRAHEELYALFDALELNTDPAERMQLWDRVAEKYEELKLLREKEGLPPWLKTLGA